MEAAHTGIFKKADRFGAWGTLLEPQHQWVRGQRDLCCEFEASLVDMVSSMGQPGLHSETPVFKKKNKKVRGEGK